MANIGPWQILLILAVILLIFGAARLPALAKSLGQSARAFKGEMKQMKDEDQVEAAAEQAAPATTAQPTVASQPTTPAPNEAAPQQGTGYTLNGQPVAKPGETPQP